MVKNMDFKEIISMPMSINKNHESLYKSFHILDHVMVMAKRGDSNETIIEVVNLLRELDDSKGNKS